MSEDSGCKLRDLLPANIGRIGQTLRTEIESERPKGGAALAWDFIATSATEKIVGALDEDVFELLARSWCVARELKEYTDPVKHPPGERSVVRLGRHKFTTSAHPVLTFRIGGFTFRPLRFTVELTAHFEPLELDIENGRIRAIGSGECKVSAQLKYGSVALHKAKESRHLKLPGRYRFESPGLAIG